MNRRSFIHSSALTMGALTIAQQKIFAAMVDDPWKIEMLRGDVGILPKEAAQLPFIYQKKGL